MRERRVERVGTAAATRYLAKAEEFLATGEDELLARRWNAAGLAAIHSGISGADAALAKAAGVRSRETDHTAVIALLDERVGAFSGATRRQLVGLLRSKNAVEYEDRLLGEVEVMQLVDSARRFCKWARSVVLLSPVDIRELSTTQEELAIQDDVRVSRAQIEAGQGLSHDEAKARVLKKLDP